MAPLVEPAQSEVDAVIIDDANHPAVEGGMYVIGYTEAVEGYHHAYRKTSPHGFRSWVAYSRSANHPPDPRCPECVPHPHAETNEESAT